MKFTISSTLRKLASALELDTTPTDRDLEEKKKSGVKVVKPISTTQSVKTRSNTDEVEHDVIKPTARPSIKPPRRDPLSKPSDWDSKAHRREYMQQYRADGNDVTNGNNYVKKNK